ncbi:MAG: hypothetical protein WCV71_00925 [Patescibacteria group bacterium]|jgi:thermostable 8-oxoguanine DNA glycosylase
MLVDSIQKYISLYDAERYLFEVLGPKIRENGYITFKDFYDICMWKSARQKQNYLKNKDVVEEITRKALNQSDEIDRINTLRQLKGVEIKTASAILTIIFPEKYAVMDERCLDILIDYGFRISKYPTIKTWIQYIGIMRSLAKENNVSPRELDMAFFAIHREKLEKANFKNLY